MFGGDRQPKTVEARTTAGIVEGLAIDDVNIFRAIPYAQAPIGDLRFADPRPCPPWSGVRSAITRGVAPPQLPSRLEYIIGPSICLQSENCLTLSIWSGARLGGKAPVLFFLPGGANITGGGEEPWYDGAELARRGRMVVVSVTYRLGALGFLSLPGGSRNMGLRDQLAAFEWVVENIEAFGGDPATITLAGHSAGGYGAAQLMRIPAVRQRTARLLLQSAPLGLAPLTTDQAALVFERVQHALGGVEVETVPVELLLEAQASAYAELVNLPGLAMPFRSCDEPELVDAAAPLVLRDETRHIPVLVGTTSAEGLAYVPVTATFSPSDVRAAFEGRFGADADRRLSAFMARRPLASARDLMAALRTFNLFHGPTYDMVEQWSGDGTQVYNYVFDWDAPGGVGAAHCTDLPFVFGLNCWKDAPIIRGLEQQLAPLAHEVQDRWIAFAAEGEPFLPDRAPWPSYEAEHRLTMRLGPIAGPVGDFIGRAWGAA